jgi:hypothetical protein
MNTKDKDLVKKIQQTITDEIFFAFGMNRTGFLRSLLGWFFHLPTIRFARVMAEIDEEVGRDGVSAGCLTMLRTLKVQATAKGIENIPEDGPVVILSNHPGAYDSMAIGSCVHRRDFKIIVGETRFYTTLPNIQPLLIMVSQDPAQTMLALKKAVEHLKQGGILMQFGSGLIEPDPAIRPVGDEVFDKWSRSLEIMLRKVPETRVVPAIASGVLQERFASHPLTWLRKDAMDKRRLAEFTQVIQQLIWPSSIKARPRISFGQAMSLDSLERQPGEKTIMENVIIHMKAELATHLDWIGKTGQAGSLKP